MALKTQNFLALISSMALGALIGEWLNIEKALDRMAEHLKHRLNMKSSNFSTGLVTATLIYCVGSMAVVGAFENGVHGNPDILYSKSLLDGMTSIVLASTLGIGVAFSAIPVLVYQGSIAIVSSMFGPALPQVALSGITATGGLLIFAIALNILGIVKLRTGNMLPALIFAALFSIWFS